jgi:hypothetical protein
VAQGGYCQGVACDIEGVVPFGRSAIIAWHNVPEAHKIHGKVVAGGMVYFDDPNVADANEFGHAVFGVESGYVWSTDILKRGRLDLVHYTVITKGWGMRLLGTINSTPTQALHMAPVAPPVTKPAVSLAATIAAARLDPARPQGAVTPGSKDDVLLVEHALAKVGYMAVSLVDGSFGTITKGAYAAWQRACGYRGLDANGIPGQDSLTKLAVRTGLFRVVK